MLKKLDHLSRCVYVLIIGLLSKQHSKVTKPTIVLTTDMHYLSDNIVMSPLHSVKDVAYGYTP